MKVIENEQIIDRLNWRYATKKYNADRKISEPDWQTLQDSLRLAPSSMGLQPYKFIVVESAATREKLREAGYGQSSITDASHFVVLAYKKTFDEQDAAAFIDLMAKTRNVERDTLNEYEGKINFSTQKASDGGYLEVWNSRQVYIALGFLLQTAALLGIDSTPMEGIDTEKFNAILGLEDYSAVAAVALGYRDQEADWLSGLAKVRRPANELIETV